MTAHVLEELAEYTCDLLPESERTRIDAHLASCSTCASEARALREATIAIAIGAPRRPAPAFLRARLLAAAESRGLFAHYTGALAKFFEISETKARALLDAIDEPAAWEPNPAGIALIHLAPGVRYAAMGADAGLVRFPAGIEWGLHKHIGEEHHLFLQGAIRIDQTGAVLRAGDVLISPPGSEHSFHVLPEEDCVAAVILTAGIEMPPGVVARFD
jgi:quercetin dioxygenase-like cupin family protein